MKTLQHPLVILLLMMGGFLLLVEIIHMKAHQDYELDVHGYVKQFCRANLELCKEILYEIE